MAEAYKDPTHLKLTAWDVAWNSNDLGWADKVTPKLDFITKEKKVGSLGNVPIGEWFLGMTGVVTAEFREIVLDLVQKMCPWWATGATMLTPAAGVDLYTYAQKLVLHPHDIAAGTLTDDLTLYKAVPLKPYAVERDGETPDKWAVDFKIFPDLSKLAALGLVYGYYGVAPT